MAHSTSSGQGKEYEAIIEKLAEWLREFGLAEKGENRIVYFSEIPEKAKELWRDEARQLLADNKGLAVVKRDGDDCYFIQPTTNPSVDDIHSYNIGWSSAIVFVKESGYVKEFPKGACTERSRSADTSDQQGQEV